MGLCASGGGGVMAERLQSYDENGPLIDLGPVKMWLEHDPLGIGQQQRHDFALNLFQLWSTESQFVAKVGDTMIKTGSTFNDYYGFGTSRREAMTEVEDYYQKMRGAQIDFLVQTKLIARPTLHDAKTPAFYNRTVRCFSLPKWRWKVCAGTSVQDALGGETTFCIWLNGEPTNEAVTVQNLIDRIKAADGATNIRKMVQ
jgi:hypothetical protein